MKEKIKPILKVVIIIAIVLSFATNGYVFYKVFIDTATSDNSTNRNVTVKDVDYDVKIHI